MSEIGEALGTAGEGGLFARAIEPGSGARTKHPDQPDKCLNCDTPLIGAYCHACGQVGHVHRSLGAFGHDLLHGALHFEGKFWRTLPMLVLRPGRLTRRYIEGARARFVSPMALFLFAIFLMFAVFQLVGIKAPTDFGNGAGIGSEEITEALGQARIQTEQSRQRTEQRLAQLAADDPVKKQLEEELQEAQSALDKLDALPGFAATDGTDAGLNLTGISWLDRGIASKWRDNPGLMLYKLQSNSYKFSWLLIPISVPFVWLMFAWRRRFNGYDHAIFVTYSLSFMTLLFIALSVLGRWGAIGDYVWAALFIIPPIHLYKQLRGTYSLSRWGAFWRLMTLSVFIWVVVILFLQILLALGAF